MSVGLGGEATTYLHHLGGAVLRFAPMHSPRPTILTRWRRNPSRTKRIPLQGSSSWGQRVSD